jgi:hypothetical protein
MRTSRHRGHRDSRPTGEREAVGRDACVSVSVCGVGWGGVGGWGGGGGAAHGDKCLKALDTNSPQPSRCAWSLK